MPIDPTRPFFLKKMVVDPRRGNVHPPIPNYLYRASDIPEQFLTDEYCTQEGVAPSPPPVPQVELKPLVTSGDVQHQDNLNQEKGEHWKQELKEGEAKLNVNKASEKEIAERLEGVGEKTAAKVVSERKKTGFADIEDLNKRVSLGFSRKWDSYADVLEF